MNAMISSIFGVEALRGMMHFIPGKARNLAYLYGFCYTLRILAELADVYQTIVWSFHMENNHLLDLFT